MTYDIKWKPNVCECIIMQDRENPDTEYMFEYKCELHAHMSDVEARADIIRMCQEKSAEIEAEMAGE